MEQFFDFLIRHWQLSGLFLVLFAVYIAFELRSSSDNLFVSPESLVDILNHRQGIVFDLRDRQEFVEGHIIGAMHLDINNLNKSNSKVNKFTDKPVVLVAKSEKQCRPIVPQLAKLGFKQVSVLSGGLDAWQSKGFSLTKE